MKAALADGTLARGHSFLRVTYTTGSASRTVSIYSITSSVLQSCNRNPYVWMEIHRSTIYRRFLFAKGLSLRYIKQACIGCICLLLVKFTSFLMKGFWCLAVLKKPGSCHTDYMPILKQVPVKTKRCVQKRTAARSLKKQLFIRAKVFTHCLQMTVKTGQIQSPGRPSLRGLRCRSWRAGLVESSTAAQGLSCSLVTSTSLFWPGVLQTERSPNNPSPSRFKSATASEVPHLEGGNWPDIGNRNMITRGTSRAEMGT